MSLSKFRDYIAKTDSVTLHRDGFFMSMVKAGIMRTTHKVAPNTPAQAPTRIDLIYSPDESSYYWQRTSDWKTSQLFSTQEEARTAKVNGQIAWEE